MRRAAIALVVALAACDGRSPTETQPIPTPARYNVVSVVSRTIDVNTGTLVPCTVVYTRSVQPGYALTIKSPTGEAWAQLVPSLWQARIAAPGYRETFTDVDIPDTMPVLGVTYGLRR